MSAERRALHRWGVTGKNREPGKWCQRCGADSGIENEAKASCKPKGGSA